MSGQQESLKIINENGSVKLDGSGNFTVKSVNASLSSSNFLEIACSNNASIHSYSGNLSIFNETPNSSQSLFQYWWNTY